MNSGMFGVPAHNDRPNNVFANRVFVNDGPFLINGKDHSLNGTGDIQFAWSGRGSTPTKYGYTQSVMEFANDPNVTNAFGFVGYGPTSSGSWLVFAKSRAVDLNQPAILATDDEIGALSWWGTDDSGILADIAHFGVYASGTPAAGDIATRFEWHTAKIGAGGVTTQRMGLENDGALTLYVDDETPYSLELFNRTASTTVSTLNAYLSNSGDVHWSNAVSAAPGWYFDIHTVILALGSASLPPLLYRSGPLTTTAQVGACEFLSGIFYQSFAGGYRGVNDVEQFLSLSATQTATSGASAQTWFPGGGATTLNIQANTTYEFEGELHLANGATTHTTAINFALAGGATLSAIKYLFNIASVAENTAGVTCLSGAVNQATSTVLNATSTAVGAHIWVRGRFRTTAAGTIAPQFTWSANPTGTNQVLANTRFRMWPIGSDSVLGVN